MQRGGAWDPAVVEDTLGVPPLNIRPVDSPVITIDDQIEPDATDWLAFVAARTGGLHSTKTAEPYAESLRIFVQFLTDRTGASAPSASATAEKGSLSDEGVAYSSSARRAVRALL
jgi:hypothetical protein